MLRNIFCGAALLLLAQGVIAAELRISGAPEPLEENIRAHIGELPELGETLSRAYRERLIDQAREAAMALGYYEAAFSVARIEQDGDPVLRITVDPGEQVRLGEVRLAVNGPGSDDPAFRDLLARAPLKEGAPLNHGEYDSVKSGILNLARRRGYFEGKFSASRVEVDLVERSARVDLVYESGPRYRLGEVRFTEVPLRDAFLERMIPFEPDAPYEASHITELNRILLETRYFDTVLVRPLPEQAENLRVPVEVTLAMAERNRVGVGVGYSTDTGPRLRLSWDKPWINDSGHSVGADLETSQVRQGITGRYRIPLRDPANDALEFRGGYVEEDINDAESKLITASIQRQQQFSSGWIRSLYLRLEREEFTVGEEDVSGDGRLERISTLVLPGISFTRTRSRGGLDPTWGDRFTVTLEGTDEVLGSDVELLRLRLGSRWVRAYDRHRLFLRLDGGAIETPSLDDVPVSLRFFAGGDQSVRGFDLDTISPRNADGDAIGGLYLLTGSAEYTYEFKPRWRAALFVDAGNATNDFDEPFKVGAGFGVHWVSPVGPVRLELAWPVDSGDLQDNDPTAPNYEKLGGPEIHISLGPRL